MSRLSFVLLQEATDEGRINKPSFTTQPVTERKREPLRFVHTLPLSLSSPLFLPRRSTTTPRHFSRVTSSHGSGEDRKPALLAVIARLDIPFHLTFHFRVPSSNFCRRNDGLYYCFLLLRLCPALISSFRILANRVLQNFLLSFSFFFFLDFP